MRSDIDDALNALDALPEDRGERIRIALNHLLEDALSTSRVQHVTAFLSEVMLQIDADDLKEAMTPAAVQGLGWILLSCHQALEVHEQLASVERHRRLREVSNHE